MGKLFDELKKYFDSTPQYILNEDWKKREYLNEIGPDVMEYAAWVQTYVNYDMPSHRYAIKDAGNQTIVSGCKDFAANDNYYLAA